MPKRKCSSVDVSLGKNLLKYRKKCGFTQQQIADMINLNRTTYTKYETGVSEPSIEILKKIAAILNADMNSLLEDEEELAMVSDVDVPIYKLNGDERNIISLYRLFSPEDKRRVVEFVDRIREEVAQKAKEKR